ncbi:MAG: sigma-70 family RNA polymerase sigma factor [Fimbriiglobus sp.]|nr:sigma-70 family RNA polymerase sigma factor [Fimbriiglobus sp.]
MSRSLFLRWTHPSSVPADADLLRRFADGGDHAAFELLVRRHASAVWAACRAVLRNEADADDAAQAVFLALARHAGSVRGHHLGGWLHRVAVNAARKLRAKSRPTVPLPEVLSTPPAPDDSAGLIHEELARLSPPYREVLIAVDLKGYSHSDAAKALGWKVGTVSGRLVRARAELKRRLERRGVTAVALASAAVSGSEVRAAVDVAVGAMVAPPVVVSLSTEVWAMVANAKRRLMVGVVAGMMSVVVLGGVGVVAMAQAPKPEPAKPSEKKADERKPVEKVGDLPEVKVKEDDTPEVKAAKEVMIAILRVFTIRLQQVEQGQLGVALSTQEMLMLTDLTSAADDAFPEPKMRLPAYEFRLKQFERVYELLAVQSRSGVVSDYELSLARAERAKAELALLKLKKQIKK